MNDVLVSITIFCLKYDIVVENVGKQKTFI